MKPSLIILFLSILLLSGILLHAASNNKASAQPSKSKKETTNTAPQKNVDFIPGSVLL